MLRLLISTPILLGLCAASTNAHAVTPDEVLSWLKQGTSTAQIIKRIEGDEMSQELSVTDTLRLKQEGVSDDIIKALIKAGARADAEDAAPAKSVEDERADRLQRAEAKAAQLFQTVDDVIAAHRKGMAEDPLAQAVRLAKLRAVPADLKRMNDAGVPWSVIKAVEPLKSPTAETAADRVLLNAAMSRTPAAHTPPSRRTFGDPGTILLEFSGSLESISIGEESTTGVSLGPALHGLIGKVLMLGVEGELGFSDAGDFSALYVSVGVFAPLNADKTLALRVNGRAGLAKPGSGDAEAVYGFAATLMSRHGKLLAGLAFSTTWVDTDPTLNRTHMELRIGTWF